MTPFALTALLSAFLLAALLTPLARRLAIAANLLAAVRPDRLHRREQPYGGGLAIAVTVALIAAGAWIVGLGSLPAAVADHLPPHLVAHLILPPLGELHSPSLEHASVLTGKHVVHRARRVNLDSAYLSYEFLWKHRCPDILMEPRRGRKFSARYLPRTSLRPRPHTIRSPCGAERPCLSTSHPEASRSRVLA